MICKKINYITSTVDSLMKHVVCVRCVPDHRLTEYRRCMFLGSHFYRSAYMICKKVNYITSTVDSLMKHVVCVRCVPDHRLTEYRRCMSLGSRFCRLAYMICKKVNYITSTVDSLMKHVVYVRRVPDHRLRTCFRNRLLSQSRRIDPCSLWSNIVSRSVVGHLCVCVLQ